MFIACISKASVAQKYFINLSINIREANWLPLSYYILLALFIGSRIFPPNSLVVKEST
jgi:hypothetical protein